MIVTKTIEADPEHISEAVAAAVSALGSGSLAHRDGLWTGADALNPDAVAVFAKERPEFDPLTYVRSPEAIHEVADIPEAMLNA